MRYQILTKLGRVSVVEEDGCIKELLPSRFGDDTTYEKTSLGKRLKAALDSYFEGDKRALAGIPVNPDGTEFQRAVWGLLRDIPAGKTVTYTEMAEKLNRPKASRAVGSACGKNPILLLVPCHRVVAKNGLGGFLWGLEAKKKLLYLEA